MGLLRPFVLLAFPALGLVAGLILRASGRTGFGEYAFIAFTLPVLGALLVEIVTRLRRGEVGLDVVAALSMAAALATGENLAAIVVALMVSGGQLLEAYAARKAGREMTALLARVPRTAMRHKDHQLEEVPLDAIAPGDRLLVRRGDVVPVDGVVDSDLAVLDQSALTGESLPVQQHLGDAVMSGSTNAGEAFDLLASRRAAESTFAGIVRLVETAQRSRAPMARLADRYAMVFLGVTLAMAGLAWAISHDPIRAVAVLVIATPCPLILAVPVAIVSGLSRAARYGVLIKGGGALETLARGSSLVLDKTGTLTRGHAEIVSIRTSDGMDADEVLRLAASLDQASQHVVARTIVAEARRRSLHLAVPQEVVELPGEGLRGHVDGREVAVGGRNFVRRQISQHAAAGDHAPGTVITAVAIDGRLAGEILLADDLRANTGALLASLRALGLSRIVLATGDRHDVAHALTDSLTLDALRTDLTPDQKVLVVLAERKYGPVVMVGDGINDAPALAAADVGVAMGARGTAASAQAADVVILVDHLDRLVPAIEIARRARVIALQSVVAGMSLSVIGMVAAAFGFLAPVEGAVLQEVIDVAVILNALRALGGRLKYFPVGEATSSGTSDQA